MKKLLCLVVGAAGVLLLLHAQDRPDIVTGIDKTRGQKPVIAIPDLRGSGDAQAYMGGFNQTLFQDVLSSGMVKIAPKTMYPLTIPQQPSDFVQPPPVPSNPRRNAPPPPQN